jgi:hypothetical protein
MFHNIAVLMNDFDASHRALHHTRPGCDVWGLAANRSGALTFGVIVGEQHVNPAGVVHGGC